MIGTMLGPYRLLEKVGEGGMGEVSKARDTRLGRDVAIKVLPANFTTDRDRLRRFEQEARTVGGLNHPNLVTSYDVGSVGDATYLIMELLEGGTLREQRYRPPRSQTGERLHHARRPGKTPGLRRCQAPHRIGGE